MFVRPLKSVYPFALALVLYSSSLLSAQSATASFAAESSSTSSAGELPALRVAQDPTLSPPPPQVRRNTVHLFSTVAVAATVGTGGFGFQVATPLAQKFNLRAGAEFFGYSASFNDDGLQMNGDLKLRSSNLSVDWFPFHGGFHISPGLTLYNGNNLNSAVTVASGGSFTLNHVSYTSSTIDPVHGSAALNFGNTVDPQITFGFGNMIPRSGRHFSVPFDIGFEYTGAPQINLNLQGTACQGLVCAPAATDPGIQSNLKAEQTELSSDLSGLRFYPILRLGFSYKF